MKTNRDQTRVVSKRSLLCYAIAGGPRRDKQKTSGTCGAVEGSK